MKKELVPIFLIVLVDLMGLSILIPLLPFYAQRFGATAMQAGMLASSFAVCQLIAGPWLGAMSDRYGRKPVLVFSQIGTLFSLVLMTFADSLPLLFLARMLAGLTAANIAVAQAYVADVTEPQHRTRAFAFVGVAFGLGLFIGPALSGLLAGRAITAPIWLAVGFAAVSLLTTILILPSTQPGDAAKREKASGRRVAPWRFFQRQGMRFHLTQFLVFVFAFSFFVQGMGLFLEKKFAQGSGLHFGPAELGYLYSYCGFLGIIFQGYLVGKLAPRFGEAKLAAFSFVVAAIGFTSLGWVTGIGFLVASSTLFSFGNSHLRPSLTSLVSQSAAQDEQGEILGLTSTLQSLGQVVAPVIGGFLIDSGDLIAWPVTLGGLYLVGFAMYAVAKLQTKAA